MKSLITGVAGFIGSSLADSLLDKGHKVVGIDCFTDYYPKEVKMANLAKALKNDNFTLIAKDMLDIDLASLLENVEYVFHEAAQPGVRKSWGRDFNIYVKNNILATQHLLEAAKDLPLKKLVFASSSSVYGNVEIPTRESTLPKPISPYGVSKLAAENLCSLYYHNYKMPMAALRYFTVYGPRQRPDMAFNKFIRKISRGEEITIYGKGDQSRDFTYIDDVVNSNILAAYSDSVGEVFNIGGGSRITINDAIKKIECLLNKDAKVRYEETQRGDVMDTSSDITKARKILGYVPSVEITEGLRREIDWLRVSDRLK